MERIVQILRIGNKLAKGEIKNYNLKSKEIILNKQIFGNQNVFASF
jgi:hypothetical protein